MAKQKSNWDRLQAQDPQDTARYRDVYEDQQLERSRIMEKQSPTSRIVFTIICSLLVSLLIYLVLSFVAFGTSALHLDGNADVDPGSAGSASYEAKQNFDCVPGPDGAFRFIIDSDEDGQPDDGQYYETMGEAKDAFQASTGHSGDLVETTDVQEGEAGHADADADASVSGVGSVGQYLKPTFWKVVLSLLGGLICFSIVYPLMMRNLEAQNMLSDTSDINQYQNDQHVALPEEIQRKFDWFPDVGAHSDVQFSSMISHMALQNKGLKKIELARRTGKGAVDEDGEPVPEGTVITDEDGNPVTDTVPMIDEKFMEALFDASGAIKDKKVRKYYDATQIPYNPDGSDRDKLGKFKTVADLINTDWDFPYYEPQRPAGAYLVDTAPVNTMVLAITRAGKGQTVIEYKALSILM